MSTFSKTMTPSCYNLAKQLSHYLYIFFFFFFSPFIWTYYTRKECRKVSHNKCHTSQSHDNVT